VSQCHGPALQLNQADSERQVWAELRQMAVKQGRRGDEAPAAGLPGPFQLDRQAAVTGLARWILHGTTALTLLQLEPARRSGGRHTQRCRTMRLQGWSLHNTDRDHS